MEGETTIIVASSPAPVGKTSTSSTLMMGRKKRSSFCTGAQRVPITSPSPSASPLLSSPSPSLSPSTPSQTALKPLNTNAPAVVALSKKELKAKRASAPEFTISKPKDKENVQVTSAPSTPSATVLPSSSSKRQSLAGLPMRVPLAQIEEEEKKKKKKVLQKRRESTEKHLERMAAAKIKNELRKKEKEAQQQQQPLLSETIVNQEEDDEEQQEQQEQQQQEPQPTEEELERAERLERLADFERLERIERLEREFYEKQQRGEEDNKASTTAEDVEKLAEVKEKEKEQPQQQQQQPASKTKTRVEQAKEEALMAFGGESLEEVLKKSSSKGFASIDAIDSIVVPFGSDLI